MEISPRRRASARLGCGALLAVIASVLIAPAGAEGAPVTIGQLPESLPPTTCNAGPFDSLQHTVRQGSDYTVPAGYSKMTSWSTFAGEGAGQTLTMKVFEHVTGYYYVVVAHDGPRALTPGEINTFPVDIDVLPGEVVGNNDANASTVNNACGFTTGSIEDLLGVSETDLVDGLTGLFPLNGSQTRLNVEATVAIPPAIGRIGPTSGPTSGGTTVLLAGHDLTGATAVRFGSIPAASFTVNSDNAITSVSPPSGGPGVVDVTVTTAAGTTATDASDQFTYTPPLGPITAEVSCVVPKLKGKKLKAAKKKLKKAECELGEVKHKRGENARKGKTAKVIGQSALAGKVLPGGSKVNIKIG